MTSELIARRPSWMTPFGREGWGDVFFDRLWPEWRRDMGEEWSPCIDVGEENGSYVVRAEIPGVKKKDIDITVDKGILTLTGKKESKKEEEGTNYYLKETSQGAFRRSFRLPAEVEEDQVDATYKNGILTVVLPQKKSAGSKKIEINAS